MALVPNKTCVEQAEALYRKARKQERAAEQLLPLLDAAREQMSYLDSVAVALDHLEESDLAALQDIREELSAAGYMKAASDASLAQQVAAKAKKRERRSGKAAGADAFRVFSSPSGSQVLVGRNNRQNDELTHKVARPTDVWLHARGVPGAHVLLRRPNDEPGDVPAADLQFAADLAAWFCKARLDSKVPVITASPKDVKRPKGAAPGQVLVSKENVVIGFPDRSAAAGSEVT